MCGIFGFSAFKGKEANLYKLKMLGMYNTSRGTDSCGYYYSGHLAKGVVENKDFSNFIANEDIIRGDGPVDIFLGHTRKSTFGQHNEENAHPHLINDRYIQTHNGVIQNEYTLGQKYGYKYNDYPIDSILLAKIIEKHGFGVLEEYTGFAALAMVFKDKPESLFLYHGATKEYYDSEYLTSERPLYILEQPEGLYYSSMVNSLNAINECDEDAVVQQLIHNVVFEVKNGKFTNNRVKINRELVGTKERYVAPPASRNFMSHPKNNRKHFNRSIDSNDDNELNVDDMIYSEIVPVTKQDVYYRNGRYFGADGKLLNGIYTIDRTGKILLDTDDFNSNRFSKPEIYYFYDGAMIKDKDSYEKLKSLGLSRNINHMGQTLSKYSRYPTICLVDEYTGFNHTTSKWLWHKEGDKIKGKLSFDPKFSQSKYTIKQGKTLNIIRNR